MKIEQENKNKQMIIISLAVVLFIALMVWIIGYFSLNRKVNGKSSITYMSKRSLVLKTDEELKKDISNKVSQIISLGYVMDNEGIYEDHENILYSDLYTSVNENSFLSNSSNRLKELFENKDLKSNEKNYIALREIKPTKLTIATKDIQSEVVKQAIIQNEKLNIKTDILQISEKDVEKKYGSLFDTTMKHKTIEGCSSFYYDKVNKVYYYIEKCKDVPLTNTYLSIYKDNYRMQDDEVLVDVTVAYVEEITEYTARERKKLAGVYISKDSNFKDEIKLVIGTEFKIDETNKKDFNTYKFVFKRDYNNVYKFEGIRR